MISFVIVKFVFSTPYFSGFILEKRGGRDERVRRAKDTFFRVRVFRYARPNHITTAAVIIITIRFDVVIRLVCVGESDCENALFTKGWPVTDYGGGPLLCDVVQRVMNPNAAVE